MHMEQVTPLEQSPLEPGGMLNYLGGSLPFIEPKISLPCL